MSDSCTLEGTEGQGLVYYDKHTYVDFFTGFGSLRCTCVIGWSVSPASVIPYHNYYEIYKSNSNATSMFGTKP